MKKQLFTLMMAFALVLGLSVSANAQGLFPTATYEIAIGTTATFEVASQTGNEYLWDVFELSTSHVVGATATATVNGSKVDIDAPTSNSTSIKFYAMPASGNLFVVQVTETETATGTCSTIRRFYVSLFDFDIQVVALDVNQATQPSLPGTTRFSSTADSLALASCNSWSGTVISNYIDSTRYTAMFADSLNNATDGDRKYTDSYFAVRVNLLGGPTFANYRARFQWSIDTISASTSIYQIEIVDGAAAFASDGGPTLWEASTNADVSAIANPTAWASADFSNNQTMYISKDATSPTEAISLVRVRTHNLAGVADMQFNMKIDRLQLEKSDLGDDDSFNNGEKFNNATDDTNTEVARLDNAKDISASITVRQSPATAIIGVND